MLWTRLCAQAAPNPVRHERIEKVFRHPIDFDENQEVSKMDGAVAGAEGEVRVIIKDKKGKPHLLRLGRKPERRMILPLK